MSTFVNIINDAPSAKIALSIATVIKTLDRDLENEMRELGAKAEPIMAKETELQEIIANIAIGNLLLVDPRPANVVEVLDKYVEKYKKKGVAIPKKLGHRLKV